MKLAYPLAWGRIYVAQRIGRASYHNPVLEDMDKGGGRHWQQVRKRSRGQDWRALEKQGWRRPLDPCGSSYLPWRYGPKCLLGSDKVAIPMASEVIEALNEAQGFVPIQG